MAQYTHDHYNVSHHPDDLELGPMFSGPGVTPVRRGPNDAAVAEFADAMHDYKRSSGRMFPTWCEVFEVLRSLGYVRPDESPSPPGGTPDSGCPDGGRR